MTDSSTSTKSSDLDMPHEKTHEVAHVVPPDEGTQAEDHDRHEEEQQSKKASETRTLTGIPFVLLIFSLVLSTWLVALNATVIGTVSSTPTEAYSDL